jgi:uncharacterized membrane protein YphA (DoxX/SURF4 family)
MKIAALIARILLGLIFFVFGLNLFLHFLPAPPPLGTAGVFLGLLVSTHYIYIVAGTQVLAGALLLVNRYVALALTLSGPLLVNILTFHILLDPGRVQMGMLSLVLWAFLFWQHKAAFAGILAPRS